MIVIIEGPDGSGKTTLAKKVVELTGAEYIHAKKPVRHPLVEYTAPLEPGKDYVLDRWHVGEMVYGPIHRGGSGLTQEQFWAVEQYLDDLGAVIVHCTGPTMDLVARLRERGEEPNAGHLRKEAETFNRVVRTSWLPTLHSPIGMEVDPEEVVDLAREQEKKRAAARC